MYTIALSPWYQSGSGERSDIASTEWNGQHFEAKSRRGATMALARLLVAAGAPDASWQAGRGGRCDLFGASLHRLADLTISEPDDGGAPKVVRWKARFTGAGVAQDGVEAPNLSPAPPGAGSRTAQDRATEIEAVG